MRNINLGCCGSSIRFALILVNALFFIMGLVVLITASVLKWGSSFTSFIDIKEVATLVKLGSIEAVSTTLIILGVFCLIISLLGLCGARYTSKCLLMIYEVVLIMLFLAHGISAIVVLATSSSLESELDKSLNSTMERLNSNETSSDVFERECKLMNDLSAAFKCCGASSPSDFKNETTKIECCSSKEEATEGCSKRIADTVLKYSVNIIFIPSAIILAIELIAIIMVPFLIGRANKRADYSSY